ncbi:ATPase [Oscillochloris trichoides DG-6]|uniref:ATPase n=1 Tax=Oscillochloris trichoides DG-6 TaxID=765420 RepID=E1IDU6_9CHLR|nr:AAA family ATPase [Oscillochloris trichoides]EFO80667.1 ATPase [Oscillochloris trichoides DG-6]
MPPPPLFPPVALNSLLVPGVAERWAAVQEHLHPILVGVTEEVRRHAAAQFPQSWPLYELSFKAQRYLNRGHGVRDPIEDYWVAFDRAPRGAGVLIAVSGAERAILVGLQLWRVRKDALASLWGGARPVWLPLITQIEQHGTTRFTSRHPDEHAPSGPFWIDRYLATRNANYLWAGFVYPWDDLPADLATRLVADVLALLPLNEALMEQAEHDDRSGPALLREVRPNYQTASPPIEVIAERIRQRGFHLADLLLRSYHLALQTKPLVILPGISGTGKTRLTRLYADALHGIPPGRENPFYLLVAVQPDWHSARDLLGYYNALTGTFHASAFTRFLLQADSDPHQTYYVCLDEMNLARPEYFLAPILSAMETLESQIDIGTPSAETPLVGGGTITNPLRLPINLRLIGTVNVDESTFALSDKLLDRANLIELTEVDLAAFRAQYQGTIDPAVWATMTELQPLSAAGGHPFGYRTISEMLRFVEQAAGTLSPTAALDLQIKQKVLPRLRGEDSPRLRRAITGLLNLTLGLEVRQKASHISAAQLAAAPYPESAAKLQRMLERLDQDGFTDFY